MTVLASVLSSFGDALDFIVDPRVSRGGGEVGGLRANGELVWAHLKLSLVAVIAACVVALPIGLWLGHTRRGAFLAVSVSNIGRAVPAIALLFVFFAFLGAGFANVALALTLLAIPPILTNAYVGVREVDPDTVDAARGMGMTGPQILRRVELPLALPLVFGGIRTSAVNVVATATIAPLAGVVTLGDPIINPSIYGEEGRLGAAILVALLAVATEVVLAGAQRAASPRGLVASPRRRLMTRTRTIVAALAALALALGLAACGGDDDDDSGAGASGTTQEQQTAAITRNAENASTTLTIGSKNFTEQQVLGEIYAQALAAAGYKIRKELNLGDEQTALKALRGGQIDGYPEYTGTALLSFFEVPTKDLPKDPRAAYDEVKSRFAEDGITAFPPTPFTSSNEVAVTQETAQRLGLKTISDLSGKSQDLVLYGSPECRGRDDCLRGLQNVYGLRFKRFVPVDIAQRHEVLTNGDADVSIVFTTDPQISRNREVLLEDDKGMFPPYNSTFLMKTEAADKAGPDLQKTIDAVNKNLTARVMQELNARVDLDKETPEEAAKDYLQQFDLVAAGS